MIIPQLGCVYSLRAEMRDVCRAWWRARGISLWDDGPVVAVEGLKVDSETNDIFPGMDVADGANSVDRHLIAIPPLNLLLRDKVS